MPKAVAKQLDDSPMHELEITDSGGSGLPIGASIGFLCMECIQFDESYHQVVHLESCSLAGQHGRRYYDPEELPVHHGPTPEFDSGHPIWVIQYGRTEGYGGLHDGEPVAFLCGECWNGDEDVFELVHDCECSLARTRPKARTTAPKGVAND